MIYIVLILDAAAASKTIFQNLFQNIFQGYKNIFNVPNIECQIMLFVPQMVSLKGPETGICVDVPLGSQYSVKIRAKPIGTIYSGHWSDWSDVLTGDTPADRSKLTLSTALP